MNFKALIKKSAQNRIGVARLTKESRMKKRQKYKEFEWVHNFKSISQSTYNIYDETLISFQFIQPSYFMAVLHISNPFSTKKVTVSMSYDYCTLPNFRDCGQLNCLYKYSKSFNFFKI